MYQNKLYLCNEFISKLTYPLINTTRTRGSLVQATVAIGLTSSQQATSRVVKNITVCSSSCKIKEVSGIPSLLVFTCREGKISGSIINDGTYIPNRWIQLPGWDDTEQFICNGNYAK
jgi:hypothetical protein